MPSTSEASHNPISGTGLAAILGTAALAGSFLLDWRQRNSTVDHESCLVAIAHQKLADAGFGANFSVSNSGNTGCLRIELDIAHFAGMPRAERERRVSCLLEDALEDKLKEIEIVWCRSHPDEPTRRTKEDDLERKCTLSEADTETGSDFAESEHDDDEEASDDGQSCCAEMTIDPTASPLAAIEPTKTRVDAGRVMEDTAVCSGLVAERRRQIAMAGCAFRPADTWEIPQGIVPELRKQWSHRNVD